MKSKPKTTTHDTVQTTEGAGRTGANVTVLRPKGGKGTKGKQKKSSCKASATAQVRAPTHEQIAERARAIWMERGCAPGQDERNWLEAEAQLWDELDL